MIRETELYHHGVPGMKWGVRRYQNKDGSLTYAGKKRALKMRDQYTQFSKDKKYRDGDGNLTYKGKKKDLKMKEKYSELTGKRLTKFQDKKHTSTDESSTSKSTKPKTLKDMSDQELRDKVNRIHLENEYKRLTTPPPQEAGFGKSVAKKFRDKAADKIIEKGASIAGDYIDKKLRDKFGISTKEAKSQAEMLKELAGVYESRMKIDRGKKYFGEGKYAKKNTDDSDAKKTDAKKSDEPERVSGEVVGVGTSSRQTNNSSSSSRRYSDDDAVDGEYREVYEHRDSGKSYVTALLNNNSTFLLEDKKRG